MNHGHFNPKTLLISLGLILCNQLAFSESLPTCPNPSDLQSMHLTTDDLKEISPPHQECCTAGGFPYFVDGTWEIDKIVTIGSNTQWRISSRKESGRTSGEALSNLKELFINLPQPWLINEYGHWVCEYGYAGVAAWLVMGANAQ